MSKRMLSNWKDRIVAPEKALSAIKPGMSIFVGTGMAEPRTLVRHLQAASGSNIQDLQIVQLMSLDSSFTGDNCLSDKYRVKTFHSGCTDCLAIAAGQVDFIPSHFSRIPSLFESGAIQTDAAFIQISPPDPYALGTPERMKWLDRIQLIPYFWTGSSTGTSRWRGLRK